LPTSDTIVDVNKGYALRRIGTYSFNMEEQVVHTFVPLNDFCFLSPKADVCLYNSFLKTANVLELVTMIKYRHMSHTFSTYDKDNISKIITKDISRVLEQHHPDEVLRNTKSNVHFINNQFRYQTNDDKALTAASPMNTVDNSNDILHFRPTSIDMIIKQINNNKISFEYLSHADLKLFLTAIFSTIDTSYTISTVEESLNTFTQFIVGQSIYALRYCALSRKNSLSSQPCLAISTLFLRIPTDSALIYSIYRLIPLPIVFNDDKYIYSNLPKVIGINSIDQTLIMWNDESDINECTLSHIVQCPKIPFLIPLSKSSCLSQLFDDNKLITSTCQVARSQDIHKDIMEIDNGIWLFFNVREPYYCQIHSTLNELTETISINEPAVVRMPCEKKIVCTDLQISSTRCVQRRVIVTPSFTSKLPNIPNFIVPIKNMSATLLSTYELQSQQSVNDVIKLIKSKKSKFQQFIHDLGIYILSGICFIILTVILYIIKFIKYKLQKEVNNLENAIEDMLIV